MKTTYMLNSYGVYSFAEIKSLLWAATKEYTTPIYKKGVGVILIAEEQAYHDTVSKHIDMMLVTLNHAFDAVKTIDGIEKHTGYNYLKNKCDECCESIALALNYKCDYEPDSQDIDIELDIIKDDLIELEVSQGSLFINELYDGSDFHYYTDTECSLKEDAIGDFLKDIYIDELIEGAKDRYMANHIYTELTLELVEFEKIITECSHRSLYEDDLTKFKEDLLNEMLEFTRIETPITIPISPRTISDFFHFKDEIQLCQVLNKHLKGKKGGAIANYLLALEELKIISLINITSAHLYAYLRSEFNMKGSDQGINKCLKDVSPYREKQITDILEILKQELSL